MPINMSISIMSSVGAGGTNDEFDARAVQRQLNAQMNPPRKYLSVDGKVGRKTIASIRDFQRCVCRYRHCDGRVDPNGKTLRLLNQPESEGKWAGMSMAPETEHHNTPTVPRKPGDTGMPTPQLPQGTTAQTKADFENVWRAVHTRKVMAADKQAESVVTQFLDYFVNNQLKDAKTVHAVLDLLNNAVQSGKLLEMGKGLKILSDLNYGNPEAFLKGLADLAKQQGVGKTMRALAAAGKNVKLGNILKGAGRVALALGILFALIESYNHYNKGRYGAALKEIYKAAGAIAVAPLGIIDAVVTAWQGLDPGIENRRDANIFFEVLRHGNLLDHGGNAIDAACTMIEITVKAVTSGKLDQQALDALVERMRNSAGKNFVELGEFLGDWYYDRLVDANKLGEDIGEYLGGKYGSYVLPLIKYFNL